MRASLSSPALVLLIAHVLCALGCAPTEQSVRPGVNDRYFAPGAADTWTAIFEGESREVAHHRDGIVGRLGLRPGMVVGDIGAGTGLFSIPLARQVGPRGRIMAVDIVPEFLERIERRVHDADLAAGGSADLAQVETILGGERSPHLPSGSLDLAFLCNVYHHLEYPLSYMRALRRALRPGARLVVIDFERIEGVTSPRMLKHIRAPREVVEQEILAAGFKKLHAEEGLLKENYFLVFSR